VAQATTISSKTLAVVVLAAGKGKRLKSATPKVLHPVCGRPALWHVLQLARAAKPTKIVVVVGHGSDDVRAAVRSWGIEPRPVFVEQTRQLGTGHAVLSAQRAVGRVADVLVANGDLDPVTPADIRALVRRHRRTGAAVTIGATALEDPGGYGRIVRDARGRVLDVIEGIDATEAVRAIHEVATNWMVCRRAALFRILPRVGRRNRQREYYLNRVIPLLLAEGERIEAVACDTGGVLGLNSRDGLAAVARVLRGRMNAAHMAAGVTFVDPGATYVDVDVRIAPDAVIWPNTFLSGATTIGARASIGPSSRLVDTVVGQDSEVAFSVTDRATIGRRVTVGPFARLRPGAVLEDGSLVGNFVEVKGARLGAGSKAKHLTYIGDAQIGEGVNIGAGTVFVNYDGYAKHTTVIEDGASIGSDTMLVAPVTIGEGAMTGAGSVITKDVPAGALAVERAEQTIVPGYRARREAERPAKSKSKSKGKRKGA
jgi:bifunctional UDP-N-acetylglucosamine pyrophosphorylase/glucosamine-1-phosphate N-acetyltransferase